MTQKSDKPKRTCKRVPKICNTCFHFSKRGYVNDVPSIESMTMVVFGSCEKHHENYTVASMPCKCYRKSPAFLPRKRSKKK